MGELVPVLGISLLLAFLAQNFERSARLTGKTSKLNIALTVALIVFMATFVGLRTNYNDTTAYTHGYLMSGGFDSVFETMGDSLGVNPGFNLTNNILIRLGASAQTFLMFYAYVTIGLYVWFLRKYSDHFCLSIFFLFTMGTYTFTMAAIKQCVAVAICLPAISRALDRKWISFVLLVLLASTFHPYALMFLIVPFMTFQPWSGKTYLSLIAFGMAGILLQSLLGVMIDITTMMGEEYEIADFAGEGINIFRLLVCAVPLVISFAVRKYAFRNSSKADNLMVNLSMLNAEIMFVGLFGTANYFGRLANYFLITQTIALPWLLQKFEKRSVKLITAATVLCYLAYFYYAHAINQPFITGFKRIGLGEYLQSLSGSSAVY